MSLLTVYLLSAVPSSVSIVCSLLVLANILTSRELRGRVYQQLVGLLAATDLLKCGSWILGNKYTNPQMLCYTQEYMLQMGSVSQAMTTTIICGVALYTVHYGRAPQSRTVFMAIRGYAVIVLILLACTIYFRTARLFCDFDEDRFYLYDPDSPLGVFIMVYNVPIYLCVLLDILLVIWTTTKLRWARRTLIAKNAKQATKDSIVRTFATRLLMYPLIIFICSVFDAVFVAALAFTHHDRDWMGAPSAVLMGCSGLLICINYFYVQRTKSPLINKMTSVLLPSGATVGSEIKSNLYITYVSSPISRGSIIELHDTQGERTASRPEPAAQSSSVDGIDVSVTLDGDDQELLSVE